MIEEGKVLTIDGQNFVVAYVQMYPTKEVSDKPQVKEITLVGIKND